MPRSRSETERPREPLLQADIGLWYILCRIGGRRRGRDASSGGANLEIPPWVYFSSNSDSRDPGGGQCQSGSLTGAVSSQIVTEESKGTLSLVGNQASSAKVEGCLTARPIGRAGAKAGLSDPVIPDGRVIAHQTKGTPGITGLSLPSVHSGGAVWHLDVGSSHPGGGEAPKGSAVRR